MTALRQRLIDDLHLRGYAARTVESYVAVVARLARHFRAAPDQLSEAQLRAYLLHLTRERKLARSSLTQALSGLRFFYEQTLGRRWTILDGAARTLRRGPRDVSVHARADAHDALAHAARR